MKRTNFTFALLLLEILMEKAGDRLKIVEILKSIETK
jgi:hypothetical protein